MSVLAIAHRAGNSLAELRTATALGVDVVEADVHAYRGRLEVRHLKTMGPLPWLWDRWELVPASAPRLLLPEVLALGADLPPGGRFMLDLKGGSTRVAHAVADLLPPDREVVVCGRWWPSVDALGHLPQVRRVLSARTRGELARLLRRLRAGEDPAPLGASVHASLLDPRVVAELHERLEVVMTWPVEDQDALDRVLDLGVTGVISGDEGVLRRVLALRG